MAQGGHEKVGEVTSLFTSVAQLIIILITSWLREDMRR